MLTKAEERFLKQSSKRDLCPDPSCLSLAWKIPPLPTTQPKTVQNPRAQHTKLCVSWAGAQRPSLSSPASPLEAAGLGRHKARTLQLLLLSILAISVPPLSGLFPKSWRQNPTSMGVLCIPSSYTRHLFCVGSQGQVKCLHSAAGFADANTACLCFLTLECTHGTIPAGFRQSFTSSPRG